MNGAPLPLDPTPPPEWPLFVLFVVGILFVFGWRFVINAIEEREKKRLDTEEQIAQAVLREHQQLEDFRIQTLINQSPGGRKPWQ